MDQSHLLNEAIEKLGGITRFAELVGETPQAVNNWRSRGVPANRCRLVESLTGITVKQLRPSDWADYWPEMAAA